MDQGDRSVNCAEKVVSPVTIASKLLKHLPELDIYPDCDLMNRFRIGTFRYPIGTQLVPSRPLVVRLLLVITSFLGRASWTGSLTYYRARCAKPTGRAQRFRTVIHEGLKNRIIYFDSSGFSARRALRAGTKTRSAPFQSFTRRFYRSMPWA